MNIKKIAKILMYVCGAVAGAAIGLGLASLVNGDIWDAAINGFLFIVAIVCLRANSRIYYGEPEPPTYPEV